MPDQKLRKKTKSRVGLVVSDKMDKTVVVRLDDFAMHSLYKKIIKRRLKVKAHDPKNSAKIGDKVRIIKTRPLSKEKKYRVIEVIKQD